MLLTDNSFGRDQMCDWYSILFRELKQKICEGKPVGRCIQQDHRLF
jgi:hypothetical protein